jgi:hypothetical protein
MLMPETEPKTGGASSEAGSGLAQSVPADNDPVAEAAASPPPGPAAAERVQQEETAALERERWLRQRFEREHQVTLATLELLIGGAARESGPMRFWRWLIDDFRSEHRRFSDPGKFADPSRQGRERALIDFIYAWLRRGTVEEEGRQGRPGGAP